MPKFNPTQAVVLQTLKRMTLDPTRIMSNHSVGRPYFNMGTTDIRIQFECKVSQSKFIKAVNKLAKTGAIRLQCWDADGNALVTLN